MSEEEQGHSAASNGGAAQSRAKPMFCVRISYDDVPTDEPEELGALSIVRARVVPMIETMAVQLFTSL